MLGMLESGLWTYNSRCSISILIDIRYLSNPFYIKWALNQVSQDNNSHKLLVVSW
jgi:hypothetical protein